MISNHWRAADELAERLGLDPAVRDSVQQTFERWDGEGVPHGAKGTDIDAATRVGQQLAEKAKAAGVTTVVFDRGGFLFHGRVKALAEAAREGGLEF